MHQSNVGEFQHGDLASSKSLRDAEENYALYVAGVAIHVVRLSDRADLALPSTEKRGRPPCNPQLF